MIRNYALLAALLIVFSISATAQQRPNNPPPGPKPSPAATAQQTPPTAAATNMQLPTSKIAVIYSDMFLDSKTGIAKFTTTLARLNGEFQKVRDELNQMQQRSTVMEEEINKLRQAANSNAPIDQTALQAKIDQLEQLKRDFQRKGEDAQTAYNKRRQELFNPLQTEVGQALATFAKARGINAILDGAQVPILYATESMDITRAFINEFNSKNPATAVTTPPQ